MKSREDNTGATKQVFDAISKINDRLAEKRKSSHSISSKLPTVHTEKISRDPSSRSADMLPGAAQGPMRPEKLQEIQKAPEGLERDQKRATAREIPEGEAIRQSLCTKCPKWQRRRNEK